MKKFTKIALIVAFASIPALATSNDLQTAKKPYGRSSSENAAPCSRI